MIPAMTYPQHIRAILVLGLPLAGSQLAQVSLSLVDAMMLGWYDTTALAGEVLGGSLFLILFLAGTGFASAVAPLVAAAEGRGDMTRARRVTRMALWLSMGAGLVCLPILLNAEALFLALGQKPDVAEQAGLYLDILAYGIFPAHAAMVLKSHLAAMERTRVVLIAMLVAVAVNAAGNYALIFGEWGAPELGIRGAAIASLVMHFATVVFLVIYVQRSIPEHALFVRLWRPDWEVMGDVFRLGWPIGLTLVAEVGLFGASSIMMGWVSETALVAHGIALQITSVTFMIHLGLSQAATVRAGRAHGRGTISDLKRGARMALVLSGIAVVATIIAFVTIPGALMGLFIDPEAPARAEIIRVGSMLLLASAVFQLADAFQVMALGLLRGLQDTQRPMVYAAVSYWVVGVPTSYVLGFTWGLGGVGVWLGLATGLALAAVLMMARLWRTMIPAVQAEVSARLGIKAGTARPAPRV
ncbi:MATE family efflux transporter [Pseudooceanicola spongiae]|uniref:Multidrug-efflux transporter n=1 Tax=Pseudooceanicola spongiae TaxID=2613965 RepID=A0A7L9WN11_9RHOB|nr:MATE family efflux transporter [Pseudooceanicola spongiae]